MNLAEVILPNTRLNLHLYGPATVIKVGPDHVTNEMVAQVKPDYGSGSMFLSLAYCAKVLA